MSLYYSNIIRILLTKYLLIYFIFISTWFCDVLISIYIYNIIIEHDVMFFFINTLTFITPYRPLDILIINKFQYLNIKTSKKLIDTLALYNRYQQFE